MSSVVQKTLENQRSQWAKITSRILSTDIHGIPMEPPKRILLFGVGSSYFVARLTAMAILQSWMKTKTLVQVGHSLEIGSSIIPSRGDWCIGFSHRGKTPATLNALKVCDRMGGLPFLITGQLNVDETNFYEAPPFVKFHIQSAELEKVEPHTASVTGALCAATTLILGAQVQDEWNRLSEELNPDLEQCRERVDPNNPPSWILGEYQGEWIAREVSLKLMEMAFVQSKAFGSEEFFHGPRYSFRSTDSIWHFSTDQDLRNDEIKPALRIAVDTHSAVSFVSALVEAQWLCLALALKMGVDPDSAGKTS